MKEYLVVFHRAHYVKFFFFFPISTSFKRLIRVKLYTIQPIKNMRKY